MKNKLSHLFIALALILVLLVSCDDFLGGESTPNQVSSIKGTVSLPSGAGLDASDLSVRILETGKEVSVSKTGEFYISGLEETTKYTLYFYVGNQGKDNTYGAIVREVSASKNGTDLGAVKLSRTGMITGSVYLSDNTSLEGITVSIPEFSMYAKIMSDGTFVFEGIPEGTYTLVCDRVGYVSETKTVNLVSRTTGTPVCKCGVITLKRDLGTIKGVVSLDGVADNERQGISITLETDGFVLAETETDPFGNFSFANIASGTYKIRIKKDGYHSITSENIVLSATETYTFPKVFSMEALGGTFKGLITVADEEGFVSDFNVLLVSADGKHSYSFTTGSSGVVLLENCFPGTYNVTISKDGYESALMESIVITYNSIYDFGVVSFEKAYGTLRIKIEELDNGADTPIDISVLVNLDENGEVVESVIKKVSVVGLGPFDINNIPIGQYYTVLATASGYSESFETDVVVVPNLITNVNLPGLYLASGAVSGNVIDVDGNPIEGATVYIGTENAERLFTCLTDSDGRFSKTKMPEGVYYYLVVADGYSPLYSEEGFSVLDEGVVVLSDLVLELSTGFIEGKVFLDDETKSVPIKVVAVNGNGTRYEIRPDENGHFKISACEPGSYVVTYSANGFSSHSIENCVVTAGDVLELEQITLISEYGILNIFIGYKDKNVDNAMQIELYKGDEYIRSSWSNSEQSIVFTDVPVGTGYRVVASSVDYDSAEKDSITVNPNSTTVVYMPNLIKTEVDESEFEKTTVELSISIPAVYTELSTIQGVLVNNSGKTLAAFSLSKSTLTQDEKVFTYSFEILTKEMETGSMLRIYLFNEEGDQIGKPIEKTKNYFDGIRVLQWAVHILPTEISAVYDPVLSHPSGLYYNEIEVTGKTDTEGATIYYSIDGGETFIEYEGESHLLDQDITIYCYAVKEGSLSSKMTVWDYHFKVDAPTPSVPAGEYEEEFELSFSSRTEDAKIYYTLDGISTQVYSEPIPITDVTAIGVYAVKPGFEESDPEIFYYGFKAKKPVFSVAAGTYEDKIDVKLSSGTEGATIYYTLDGSNPDEFSEIYNSRAISVWENTEIRAIAVKEGLSTSDVAVAKYIIDSQSGVVVVDPPSSGYSVSLFSEESSPVSIGSRFEIECIVSPDSSGAVYKWFVDGEPARTAIGAVGSIPSIMIGSGVGNVSLAKGAHVITVEVTIDNKIFTDTLLLKVSD